MAPGQGKSRGRVASGSNRRPKDDVPDVYRDMLAQAALDDQDHDRRDRPFKRRKTAEDVATALKLDAEASNSASNYVGHQVGSKGDARRLQTIEDYSASEDDASEFEFEDVNIEPSSTIDHKTPDETDDIRDLSISLAPSTSSKATPRRRKPASAAEKASRLVVHKLHFLCLLGSCAYINGWCNNVSVHQRLRPLLTNKMVSSLITNPDETQLQRSRHFLHGLEQASHLFRAHFKITSSGMRSAIWHRDQHVDDQSHRDIEMADRSDFIAAARDLEGSQDTANQLFCALLRSVGVKSRLVCSLQTLPFANLPPKSTPSPAVAKTTVFAEDTELQAPDEESNTSDLTTETSSTIGKVPPVRRRLGQPSFRSEAKVVAPIPEKREIRKLSFPIFWIEAFNSAQQKWIPIDPIVTSTINKASQIEPPSSYDLNQMSYVIAFEEDGVAKDVTRRYARAYNAKTRRGRLESSEGGALWLKKALRPFRRRGAALDRDQVEDSELAQKEAREGLPNKVQDFKDHPYYALERHLKRHEVIQPRREVGKLNAGTAAKPRMESVYRRGDVLMCRSADKWYRLGQEVKAGEQPLKHVPSRSTRAKSIRDGDEDASVVNSELVALYAQSQTKPFLPEPVVRGRVPRNAFGNLDIYVPSMVPAGGTHIRHNLGRQAAKILRIDCVDAVTGFQFKGRHGTAIVEGVVIASQYADAVRSVIEGLEDEKSNEDSLVRSSTALRMWRRFFTGLRIAERVSAYGNDASNQTDAMMLQDGLDPQEPGQQDSADAGGFFPEDSGDTATLPTAGKFSLDDLTHVAIKKKGRARRKLADSESDEDYMGDENALRHAAGDAEEGSVAGKGWRASRSEDEDRYADHDGSLLEENAGGFFPVDPPDDEVTTNRATGGFSEGQDGVVEGHGGDGFISEAAADVENDHSTVDKLGCERYADADSDSPVNGNNEESGEASVVQLPISPALELDTEREHKQNSRSVLEGDGLPIVLDAPNMASKSVTADCSESGPLKRNEEAGGRTDIGLELDCSLAESDNGSMLSHDPEDEDAEPDWLESD